METISEHFHHKVLVALFTLEKIGYD